MGIISIDMTFTGKELSAVLKMAQAVAQADGNVSGEENILMAMELLRFGVKELEAKRLIKEADALTSVEACVIISQMAAEKKRYVTAYLGTMICADGKIEDSEVKVWAVISNLCSLPEMDIKEAVTIMANL